MLFLYFAGLTFTPEPPSGNRLARVSKSRTGDSRRWSTLTGQGLPYLTLSIARVESANLKAFARRLRIHPRHKWRGLLRGFDKITRTGGFPIDELFEKERRL